MANSTTRSRSNNRQQVAMPNQPEQRSAEALKTAAILAEGQPRRKQVAPKAQQQPPQSFTIAPLSKEEIRKVQNADFDASATNWPAEAIKEVNIRDEAYPEALKRVNNPPETLYYVGNYSLLFQESVAISLTRYTSPTDERLASYSNQQSKQHETQLAIYEKAKELAEASAWHLATKGKTIMVSTIREADIPAMAGAIHAGGSVIVVLPSNIGHSQLDLAPFRSFVDEGRLLFISQFKREVTWNVDNAQARNVTMAALSDKVVILECTSLNGGTGSLAMIAKALGKEVFVRAPRYASQACKDLVNIYQCRALAGKSVEEAMAALIDESDTIEAEAEEASEEEQQLPL